MQWIYRWGRSGRGGRSIRCGLSERLSVELLLPGVGSVVPPGTVIVEKYRPQMNKLTDAERARLLARAMTTIYGQPESADRR